jgi:hypothetical protein
MLARLSIFRYSPLSRPRNVFAEAGKGGLTTLIMVRCRRRVSGSVVVALIVTGGTEANVPVHVPRVVVPVRAP